MIESKSIAISLSCLQVGRKSCNIITLTYYVYLVREGEGEGLKGIGGRASAMLASESAPVEWRCILHVTLYVLLLLSPSAD